MSLIKIAPGAKLTDSKISGNTQVGGDSMIDNQGEIEGSEIKRNLHITARQIVEKRWFEKPLGIVFLAVVGAVVSGGLIYYFGWH